MRYLALACDYDGTLAQHGRVTDSTVAALEKLRATGRKLILVTGRELDKLLSIFPRVDFFEQVVAENGALLYRPGAREEKLLAEPPPANFIHALRERGVAPMSVGRAIVAAWKPHETILLETIRDLGLEHQVIFNKDAVMVLPAGVNKATGLGAALKELELSPHEVVGVGDAENDHAFLSICECSVAVDNALPSLKDRADLVMRKDHGAGVEELIEHILDNDLQDVRDRLTRHHLLLGKRPEDGAEEQLAPYGINLLIAGPSGSGKSTVATSFLERLLGQHYQFCIIDPEGDYEGLEGAVTLGDNQRGPSVEEVLQLLRNPEANAVVNLVGLRLADRPPFFLALWPRLQEMRARTGRPHWIIVDEAHHLLPAAWEPGPRALPQQLERMVFITVHANQVAPALLPTISTVIAVGQEPEKTIGELCEALQEKAPPTGRIRPKPGEVVVWHRHAGKPPFRVEVAPSRMEHRRHVRKYAEGELPPERSFYFRGPEKKLNLRAQNLFLFNQIAEGVDDATWQYHLEEGDYSRWFREGIKNEELAAEAEQIERRTGVSAADTRTLLKAAIERYYTIPATAPLPMPGTDEEAQRQDKSPREDGRI